MKCNQEDILNRFKSLPGPFGQYGLRLVNMKYIPNNDMRKWINDYARKKDHRLFTTTIQLDIEYLLKHRKAFYLYKWTTDFWDKKTNLSPQAAYAPWIIYKSGKFRKVGCSAYQHIIRALIPMHKWFKDEKELINWLGEEHYNRIFTDLLSS